MPFFFGTAKAKAREQKPRKAQVSSKHWCIDFFGAKRAQSYTLEVQ